MKHAPSREVWYSGGIHFACRRCGKCCRGEPGYVWVKPDEVRRMAEHLDMTAEEFRKRYVRREGMRLSLRERANGDCVLWEDGCTVYACRPSQCRTFPFWIDGLRSEHTFEMVIRACPGVGSGRLYTVDEILRIAAERDDT